MGVIFNLRDELEEVPPGMKIMLCKLDFIADRFGYLCLQEPKPTEEGEQSLQIRTFAAGLEEAMDEGPLTIAHHLAHHSQLFAEPSQEPRLNANLFLHKIRDLVPMSDTKPDSIRSRFSGAPTTRDDDSPDLASSSYHTTFQIPYRGFIKSASNWLES